VSVSNKSCMAFAAGGCCYTCNVTQHDNRQDCQLGVGVGRLIQLCPFVMSSSIMSVLMLPSLSFLVSLVPCDHFPGDSTSVRVCCLLHCRKWCIVCFLGMWPEGKPNSMQLVGRCYRLQQFGRTLQSCR